MKILLILSMGVVLAFLGALIILPTDLKAKRQIKVEATIYAIAIFLTSLTTYLVIHE